MITLTTILYEGNFRFHLKENPWFRNFKSKYITKKRLLINNLSSTQEFEDILNDLYDPNEVELIYVSDYADKVIDIFNLNTKEGEVGYNYTVPYFVNIHTCTTPYFFNVSSDCCVDICVEDSFFEKSICLLEKDNGYIVTSLPTEKDWSIYGYPSFTQWESEQIHGKGITCQGEWEQVNIPGFSPEQELEDFWCSATFWDGVFLGHVEKLKSINYSECFGTNHIQAVAPYGGRGAFENRIADYLMYNNVHRAMLKSKTQYAMHTNSAP
jgi:hypothetical protein